MTPGAFHLLWALNIALLKAKVKVNQSGALVGSGGYNQFFQLTTYSSRIERNIDQRSSDSESCSV